MSSNDEGALQSIYFWLRCIVTLCAVLVPFHHRILVFVSALLLALKTTPQTVVMDGEFVKRPGLEEEFLEALRSPDSETVLIYGERGGGKTSLIQHALHERRGVVTVRVTKVTHDEAQEEMIESLSNQLHIFHTSQQRIFIEDVFSSFRTEPIVVVSLEARCGGEALEGVITTAKVLSYDNRHKGHPRIVVDISGSRAAIEAGVQFEKRRVIGVHVGLFEEDEALDYVKERMPRSFKDELRRKQIAEKIVKKFDCHVLTLKKICKLLNKAQPSTEAEATSTLEKLFDLEVERALHGWRSFCKNVETELEETLSLECWRSVIKSLLEGSQKSNTIIGILEKHATKKKLVERDIGLANADASYHPLAIDPFQPTLSFSGKVVVAALSDMFSINIV